MKIEYDKEADALYVQFRAVHPADNVDIEDGVTVDLDANGHIVGIEILDALERLGAKSLQSVTVEDIPVKVPPRKRARLVKHAAAWQIERPPPPPL